MKSIILREIKTFFGSIIGYLVIAIFLIINGLLLWVFDSPFNIINTGFADLSPFFELSGYVFIFLIPAITMRSFSDEKRLGTLELLLTKPISVLQIVLGKFLGSFLLVVLAILPTIMYVFVLQTYSLPQNSLDLGSVLGSYFGMLFLIASYTSIGIFTSTLSENQIVAFIISVILCFFFYYGFEALANILGNFKQQIAAFGMENHFISMSRGVLDSRDILYFVSLTAIFLSATVYQLKKEQF